MTTGHRGFWGIGFVLAMIMVSANVPSPLYAVYAHRWGFGTATITAIFAVYVACLIPTLLVGGQWSDHRGRKPVIAIGWGCAIIGAAAFLAARDVGWLFLARAAQGAGAGLLSGAATAHLAELDGSRGRAALIAGLATAGGTAVGPLLGGVLAQYGPWPLRLGYAVSLAGLLVGGAAIGLATETRPRQSRPFRWTRPRIPSSIRYIFWVSAATAFTVWSVTAFFMSLAPSYVMSLLHVNNLAVAGGVVFLMLASSSVTQLTTRQFTPARAMPIGLGLVLLSLGGLLIAVPTHALWMVLISTVVAGVGQGIAFLGSMATVTRAAPSSEKGQVVSSFYVTVYVGVGAPVLGMGVLARYTGLYGAMMYYAFFIALAALGTIISLLAGRRNVRAPLDATSP